MDLQTYAELIASGLSQAEVESKVRGGTLARVRRGVYAPARDLDPEEAHLRMILATVPAVHPDNVVSHESAAVLHGLPAPRTALGKVSMIRLTGGHGETSASLRVRAMKLRDDEVTVVSGIRVTTVARTVMDLARTLEPEWGVAACDAALRIGVDREELEAAVGLQTRIRGLTRARWVVGFADGRAESPAESVSRLQFARHGIPAPELQFEIYDDDGNWVARVDCCWREQGVVGECDGLGKYGALLKPGQTAAMAIRDEKRREEAIRDVGWAFTRWDWGLAWQGEKLCARIQRAFELVQRRRR